MPAERTGAEHDASGRQRQVCRAAHAPRLKLQAPQQFEPQLTALTLRFADGDASRTKPIHRITAAQFFIQAIAKLSIKRSIPMPYKMLALGRADRTHQTL